ncbi:hypothetical protein GCM10008927_17240 [Amylibacter ulvae]|uniref:Probable branched-chain-amino-acid aminotransferase n=1 Tax=Paramylibacter ulvae TaxID=1651968 RepID=A0ABQ3D2W4_9RHOB|nr:aminotransferase class IV family protein [Amylibacter ulvae]GHA52376.1 hypothetical protein GCM10008927_17240 [Amylibacter ulvae]
MESTLYQNSPDGLIVIETLRFDGQDGFVRLGLHLDRAARSCETLGVSFDRADALQTLGAAVGDATCRVRLTIAKTGAIVVETFAFTPIARDWNVAIAPRRLQSDDPWLRVKTNQRAGYDQDRANLPDGVDEYIYQNERGELCEGAITNLFVEIDGQLCTPPLQSGLLPGILRQSMLDEHRVREAILTPADLKVASAIYVGNSLRGLIRAKLI